MKTILIVIALLAMPHTLSTSDVTAQKRRPDAADRLVRAIYLAEGGAKAQYLYGIVSVRYQNADHARQICRRTVINNWKRWNAAGRPGPFLEYLASVYCPIGAENDPKGLNRYWLKNVRHFLSQNA